MHVVVLLRLLCVSTVSCLLYFSVTVSFWFLGSSVYMFSCVPLVRFVLTALHSFHYCLSHCSFFTFTQGSLLVANCLLLLSRLILSGSPFSLGLVVMELFSVCMFRAVLVCTEVVFHIQSHPFVELMQFESTFLKINWKCVASLQYPLYSDFSCSFSYSRISQHVEQPT